MKLLTIFAASQEFQMSKLTTTRTRQPFRTQRRQKSPHSDPLAFYTAAVLDAWAERDAEAETEMERKQEEDEAIH